MAYIKVLWGCQKGDSSAADKLLSIPNYMFIVFLRKFNLDFLQFFNVHLVLFNVHLKVQSTIESTEYIRKYINVLSDVLCTLLWFPVENISIPMSLCTFGCTLYFQKLKYKVHPKVQCTSESTRYTAHSCCNPLRRKGHKQKKESSSNQLWCVGNLFDFSQNFIWDGRSFINDFKITMMHMHFLHEYLYEYYSTYIP